MGLSGPSSTTKKGEGGLTTKEMGEALGEGGGGVLEVIMTLRSEELLDWDDGFMVNKIEELKHKRVK